MSKNEKVKAMEGEEKDTSTVTSDKKNKKDHNKETVDSIKEDLEKERERYLRLFAEFENYKKRTGRERVELFKTAGQDVMIAVLPVLDDFERALKEIERSGDDSLYKGVELIHNKLRETLRAKGLAPISTETGDTFDAEIHEAVTQIPAPEQSLKGKVIDVIEKGYTLGDKIIRFPKVVIGQ